MNISKLEYKTVPITAKTYKYIAEDLTKHIKVGDRVEYLTTRGIYSVTRIGRVTDVHCKFVTIDAENTYIPIKEGANRWNIIRKL